MSNLKNRPKLPILNLIFILLLAGSLAFGGYYFKQYRDLKSSTSKTGEELNQELISRASKVYELPKDETPTVVSVTKDPKEFTTEQEKIFSTAFKSLQKGDTVFLYEKAGKAIQYRDSENKVIDTATLAVKSGAAVQIIASAELQNSTELTLTTKFPNDVRVSGKSTPTGQYTATTVVDLSGQKADLAKKIADAVGGTVVAALPTTEKATDGAEIVVIVANAQVTPAEPTPAQ